MTGTFYCEGLTDFVGSESKSSQHHTNFQILIERKARIKNYANKKRKKHYIMTQNSYNPLDLFKIHPSFLSITKRW